MLLTDRRRLFGRREEDDARDASQGSLFAPDALAPPPRPPGPTPDPFAPPRAPADVPEDRATAPPAPADASAPGFAATDYDETEVIEPADYVDPTELEPAHANVPASRSVLAGPTLDDVMSRVWEGLRAEVPTPCPVCHAEIEPSAHGRCGACGSTLH